MSGLKEFLTDTIIEKCITNDCNIKNAINEIEHMLDCTANESAHHINGYAIGSLYSADDALNILNTMDKHEVETLLFNKGLSDYHPYNNAVELGAIAFALSIPWLIKEINHTLHPDSFGKPVFDIKLDGDINKPLESLYNDIDYENEPLLTGDVSIQTGTMSM